MRRWPWATAPPAARQKARARVARRAARRAVCLMICPYPYFSRPLFQLYVHHADQAIGHRLEILQSRRMGYQVLRMEEIDHPSLGQELGGDLLVDRLAGRQVTGGP